MTSLKVLVMQYNSFNGFVCTVRTVRMYTFIIKDYLNMFKIWLHIFFIVKILKKGSVIRMRTEHSLVLNEKKGLTLVIYAKNVWHNNVFYCSLKSALYFWITLYIKRNLMFQNEVFYVLNVTFYKAQPTFKINAASLNSQLGYEFNFFAQILSFN